MQISRLVNYLDKNINAEDRKLFNKLNKHIAAKYVRELNQLVSSYNIDRKKVLFLEDERLNEQYIYSVNQLILFCKRIVANKIDISAFNPKQFTAGKMLDLSSNTRVDLLIRHLRHYTKNYENIVISEEFVQSPLAVLTVSLKRRIELGYVDKAGKKNINKVPKSQHDIPKQTTTKQRVSHKGGTVLAPMNNTSGGFALREEYGNIADRGLYLQEVQDDFNNNFITDDENLSSIMIENPTDCITAAGVPDSYIGGDVAKRVALERRYKAERDGKRGLNLVYFLLDFVSPIAVLFLTIIMFMVGLVTTDFGLMYLFSGLTVFNTLLFLYRLGLVIAKDDSFASQYYELNFDKFKIFGVVVLFSIVLQIFYFTNFSESFLTGIKEFGEHLLKNKSSIQTGVLVFLGLDLLLLISAALFLKVHRYVIYFTQAIVFYIFILIVHLCAKVTSVTSIWRPFFVFKDYTIYFVATIVGMLTYCIFNNAKTRIFSGIAIGVVILTYLIL